MLRLTAVFGMGTGRSTAVNHRENQRAKRAFNDQRSKFEDRNPMKNMNKYSVTSKFSSNTELRTSNAATNVTAGVTPTNAKNDHQMA